MPQLALLLVCLIWGSTFFSQYIGVRAVGPNPLAACLFLGVRFAAAAVLMAVFVPGVFRKLDRQTVRDGIFLSVPFTIAFAAQVSGLRATTPTLSAFLTNLSVVFTPVLGVLVFREKVGRALLLGVVLSLAGVAIMTNPKAEGFGWGEALTVVCAVAFSVQIHLTDIYTKRSSPLGITFVLFVCATAYFLAALAVVPDGRALLGTLPRHLANADFLWPALYNALVASVIGVLLMNTFQRRVAPTRAAVIYMTEPIFAGVFAMIFIREPMTVWKIAGGAVILVGNLACELLKKATDHGGKAAGDQGSL